MRIARARSMLLAEGDSGSLFRKPRSPLGLLVVVVTEAFGGAVPSFGAPASNIRLWTISPTGRRGKHPGKGGDGLNRTGIETWLVTDASEHMEPWTTWKKELKGSSLVNRGATSVWTWKLGWRDVVLFLFPLLPFGI